MPPSCLVFLLLSCFRSKLFISHSQFDTSSYRTWDDHCWVSGQRHPLSAADKTRYSLLSQYAKPSNPMRNSHRPLDADILIYGRMLQSDTDIPQTLSLSCVLDLGSRRQIKLNKAPRILLISLLLEFTRTKQNLLGFFRIFRYSIRIDVGRLWEVLKRDKYLMEPQFLSKRK